jgi:hypothetical protein
MEKQKGKREKQKNPELHSWLPRIGKRSLRHNYMVSQTALVTDWQF